MPRPKTRDDLLKAAKENFDTLTSLIEGLSEKELNTPFDFSNQPSKKEAHWSRDKNVRDVLIHLYEWHQLLLKFPKNNEGVSDKKSAIAFLPSEYSWKTYGEMNLMFWNRHQETSLEEAKKLLAQSHAQVMKLIEGYTNEELFMPKYFAWTGNAALGDYCVSSTSSHYDWAIKKIKAHKKNCSK
jgi:hypothetical protein